MIKFILLIGYIVIVFSIGIGIGLHKTRRHDRDNLH